MTSSHYDRRHLTVLRDLCMLIWPVFALTALIAVFTVGLLDAAICAVAALVYGSAAFLPENDMPWPVRRRMLRALTLCGCIVFALMAFAGLDQDLAFQKTFGFSGVLVMGAWALALRTRKDSL